MSSMVFLIFSKLLDDTSISDWETKCCEVPKLVFLSGSQVTLTLPKVWWTQFKTHWSEPGTVVHAFSPSTWRLRSARVREKEKRRERRERSLALWSGSLWCMDFRSNRWIAMKGFSKLSFLNCYDTFILALTLAHWELNLGCWTIPGSLGQSRLFWKPCIF